MQLDSLGLLAGQLLLLDIDADIYGSPLDSALGVVILTAGKYTIRVKDTHGRSGPNFFFLLNGSIKLVALGQVSHTATGPNIPLGESQRNVKDKATLPSLLKEQ